MSSYYTAVQLETARKEQIRRELADSINRMREQLQAKHENTVQTDAPSNTELSVFACDDSVSGYHTNAVVSGAMLQAGEDCTRIERDVPDFSALLYSAPKKSGRLELELDSWMKKADERPIVSEKDEKDRARLLAELAKITRDASTDIEDKIKSVRMRVSGYLQGAVRLTEDDRARMQSSYYEYCALCEMLEVSPTERIPCRIDREISRMTEVLEKRRENEYVMEVVESVMESLGCHVRGEAVLDHTIGQLYSVDGHPLCDVFVGDEGSGIMFEPVGASRGGSLENQRRTENSANSICSLYAAVEEGAAARGVILKRVYLEPVRISEMCVQADIQERKARKKQNRTAAPKQRAFDSEG